MAYTLESLKRILEQVLCPDQNQCFILDNKSDIELLLQKVIQVSKAYFEIAPAISSKKLEILESQIIDAAHNTEDIIESHITNQLAPKFKSRRYESSRISSKDMTKIMGEFDFIEEEMNKYMEESRSTKEALQIISWSPAVLPRSHACPTMVGYDRDIDLLRDALIQSYAPKILPIVGMGGIGKTTLARNLYDDHFVHLHFDIRAWVTVSRDYNMHKVLLGLLSCIRNINVNNIYLESVEELGSRLLRRLRNEKYLIVLDDVWSIEVWNKVKSFLPLRWDDSNRIIFTTRKIDEDTIPSRLPYQMRFLNQEECWQLLSQLVFPDGDCPLELEEIGKTIAEKCIGLPLAISIIARLLSTAKCRPNFWIHVAENVSSILVRNDSELVDIVSTSYEYLPHYLKPCFLYMGTFPTDFEVPSSKLIRLWVAEGFIEPIEGKTLEDVGEKYLQDLVNRHLITVTQKKLNGKTKTCSINYLFMDVCMRKASEENFFGVGNNNGYGRYYSSKHRVSPRRVAANPSHSGRDILESGRQMSFTRSFLFNGPATSPLMLSPELFKLRLLKILDVYAIVFDEFPTKLLEMVNLKYLGITCHSSLPESTNFWKLQTLIYREISTLLAIDIVTCFWALKELRHAKFKETYICLDPEVVGDSVLENLQTLSTVRLNGGISYSKFFERSVPNLKKLGISFGFSRTDTVIDLSPLEKLDTLKCQCDSLLETNTFLSGLIFPPYIRKLTLSCSLGFEPWRSMKTIGSLPNLQVLKLQNVTYKNEMFRQYKWKPTKGQFGVLEYLLLENLNLAHWRAHWVHFPCLKHLVIRCCPALGKIPLKFSDVSTLEMIELDGCSSSLVASAIRMQKRRRQKHYTNVEVEVRN